MDAKDRHRLDRAVLLLRSDEAMLFRDERREIADAIARALIQPARTGRLISVDFIDERCGPREMVLHIKTALGTVRECDIVFEEDYLADGG